MIYIIQHGTADAVPSPHYMLYSVF